jgi:hypothetical protein
MEKFLPGITPIWCGVWLTERLESHRTVNACSALCLNAVGQVGLLLVDLLVTVGNGVRLDKGSSECLCGSWMAWILLGFPAGAGCWLVSKETSLILSTGAGGGQH